MPNSGAASAASAVSLPAPGRDAVTGPDGTSSQPTPDGQTASDGDLARRIASAIVMAALAIAADVVGAWLFVLFWAAAALGIYWEWSAMVARGAPAIRIAGMTALALTAVATGFGRFWWALVPVCAAVAAVAVLSARERCLWRAFGVVYAAAVLLGPAVLRRDGDYGSLAILFLFAVVWATDIFGYFIGRLLGGPKLASRISPKKTWAGAAGGTFGAIAAGTVVMYSAGNAALMSTACIALVLSVVSQAGDLFESAVKRRFGVKDASHVIPGHGGLMDRLDGFLAATSVAALIGLARGGTEASARGLLMW